MKYISNFLNSFEARIVRLHLVIIGYLTMCFCTLIFGVQSWEDCLLIDKILFVSAFIFTLQGLPMPKKDLPAKLRWTTIAVFILFLYIHYG